MRLYHYKSDLLICVQLRAYASLVYDALKIKTKLTEYDIGQAISISEIQSVFEV